MVMTNNWQEDRGRDTQDDHPHNEEAATRMRDIHQHHKDNNHPTMDDNGQINTKYRRSRGCIMQETGPNDEQLIIWVPR
jgi:hypothetical protein